MNSHKLEKIAACLLIGVLSFVFGIERAFAAPSSSRPSATGPAVGSGEPTCLC